MFKLVYLLLVVFVVGYSEANTLASREFVGLCLSSPCKNGATCVQIGYNLAICLCPSGLSGIFCDIPITTTKSTTKTTSPLVLCTPGICQQNGFCAQINENLAICVCQNGTSGLYCENGSPITTSLTQTSTSTTLTQPNTSSDLSTPAQGVFQLCPDQTICKNGGTCLFTPINNFFTCYCQPGFSGIFCQN